MLTASPLFALGIKGIGLTAIAAILFSANIALATTTVEEEEPEVETDGGLTATLNGESFTRGNTIIISGTVEEREGGSTVYARIYDPDSIELDIEGIHVNTDGTFRYGFVAGEDALNDGTSDPMTESGTYAITLEYFPPTGGTETTELTFEYDAEASPSVGGGDGSATVVDGPTTIFQNITEGFRIGVPTGWVEDDMDIPDTARENFITSEGYEMLGAMCPQNIALPKIGGLYDCINAAEAVQIIAYPNLNTRSEFAGIINQNQNITLNDIVALDIGEEGKQLQDAEADSRISIEGQTDTTVSLVDPITNQTVQTLPARQLVYGIPATFGDAIYVKYNLLVLAGDGGTAYKVHGYTEEPIELDDGMPPFVRQAFDSFGLLATNSSRIQQPTVEAQQSQQNNATDRTNPFSPNSATTTNLNATATPLPPQEQEPQQQEQSQPSSPFSEQLQSDQSQGQEPVL